MGRKIHRLNAQLIYNLNNCVNSITIWVSYLNKKSLKDIANVMNDKIITSLSHFKYLQWHIATLRSIKSKL